MRRWKIMSRRIGVRAGDGAGGRSRNVSGNGGALEHPVAATDLRLVCDRHWNRISELGY